MVCHWILMGKEKTVNFSSLSHFILASCHFLEPSLQSFKKLWLILVWINFLYAIDYSRKLINLFNFVHEKEFGSLSKTELHATEEKSGEHENYQQKIKTFPLSSASDWDFRATYWKNCFSSQCRRTGVNSWIVNRMFQNLKNKIITETGQDPVSIPYRQNRTRHSITSTNSIDNLSRVEEVRTFFQLMTSLIKEKFIAERRRDKFFKNRISRKSRQNSTAWRWEEVPGGIN